MGVLHLFFSAPDFLSNIFYDQKVARCGSGYSKSRASKRVGNALRRHLIGLNAGRLRGNAAAAAPAVNERPSPSFPPAAGNGWDEVKIVKPIR